jgi:uroporphyrinogen-III synthase
MASGCPAGRVLLPQAAAAGPDLEAGLRAKEWLVDAVEAYRTLPTTPDPEALAEAGAAHAIAFTSASTVDNYLDTPGHPALPPVVACIGPVTADRARRRGVDVSAVAEEASVDSLVEALAGCFQP